MTRHKRKTESPTSASDQDGSQSGPKRSPKDSQKQSAGDDAPSGFPVVAIGASAGGMAAFEAFFAGMTDVEPGMAFVLVQHMAPGQKSVLVNLIRRITRMRVVEVRDGMKLRPNCVYVIPSGSDMAVLDGVLQLLEPGTSDGLRTPIDFFLRSLARDQHEQAICILLSGTGSDGALGLREIKSAGGMAMIQEPASAEFNGMPRNAIATGLADYVLRPEEMPSRLTDYVNSFRDGRDRSGGTLSAREHNSLQKILILLRDHTGHDFSQYNEGLVFRRITRRMAVHQIESLDGYIKYLRHVPAENHILFRELLVGTTSFFRDPEAFKALGKEVIPEICADKTAVDTIRIWSVGCSTGEEAYSLAMLFTERLEALKKSCKVQIFGTDLNSQSIVSARAGLYPASISQDVGPKRLARFFTHDPGTECYRVSKEIRDMVVFSEHDVTIDHPFSRMDLISCRNVLIYMKKSLQRVLMTRFHYALHPGGFLFLCPSGVIDDHADMYTAINPELKLYRRKEDSFIAPQPVPAQNHNRKFWAQGATRPKTLLLQEMTERALFEQIAVAAALVDDQGDVLYLHGRTGLYLEPTPGIAGVNNILQMARAGLRVSLATALHRAQMSQSVVHSPGLRVQTNGEVHTVNVSIRPVSMELSAPAAGNAEAENDAPLYLVILEQAPFPADGPEKDSRHAPEHENALQIHSENVTNMEAENYIAILHQRLQAKDEELQSALQKLGTTTAELKSSNQEMKSINEELLFANKLLQDSKEKLEILNAEQEDRVAQLSRANNDLNNLFAGTGVGSLFVDRELNIVRYTPEALKLFNLIPSDVGRPLEHIVLNLDGYTDLTTDTRSVIQTLTGKDLEVRTRAGKWFLLYIRPYRTLDNVIEGAVISFLEITKRKLAEQAHLESEARFRLLFMQAPLPYQSLDEQGNFLDVNQVFLDTLGYAREELIGRNFSVILHPDWVDHFHENFPRLKSVGEVLGMEFTLLKKDGTSILVRLNGNIQRDSQGRFTRTHCIFEDITERRRAEEELQNTRDRLAATLNALPDLLLEVDDQGRIYDYRAPQPDFFCFSREEFLSATIQEILPANMSRMISEATAKALAEGYHKGSGFCLYQKDELHHFELSVTIKGDPLAQLPRFIVLVREITDSKRAEEALRKSQLEFKTLAEKCPISIMRFDQQGRVTFVNDWHVQCFAKDYLDKEFFLGKLVYELPGIVKAGISDEIAGILQGNIVELDEVFFPEFTGGHSGWVRIRGVPIIQDGVPMGGILIRDDISERKKSEQELIEANTRLQKTVAERDRFFSIIAHDLRSPFIGFLVFIKMLTQRIENLSLNDIQRLSNDMQQSAQNLYRLLENLLEWAVVQRGEGRYEPTICSLADLVRETIDLIQTSAQHKNIQIQYTVPEHLQVYVDSSMFSMILRNLLSNAIKFTRPQGLVVISAVRRDSMIVVSVEDNGMGMDQDALSRLFALDQVSSRKGTSGEKGTGLGLVLCKEYVQKFGGKIWAQSKHNRGSTFYFTLPAHIPAELADQTPDRG